MSGGEGAEASGREGAARREHARREASSVEGTTWREGKWPRGSKHLVGEESRSNGAARSKSGGPQYFFFGSCDLLALLNFCFYVLHYCSILLGF